MTPSDLPRELVEEVYRLAALSLGDAPDPQHIDRLKALLKNDQRARRVYVEFMQESAGLYVWAAGTKLQVEQPAVAMERIPPLPGSLPHDGNTANAHAEESSKSGVRLASTTRGVWQASADRVQRSVSLRMVITLLLTVVGVGLLLAWIAPQNDKDTLTRSGRPPVAESKFAAKLSRAVEASWTDASDVYLVGASIRPGERLDLESGLAEIQFNSGARVLLEGPARFRIRDAKKGAGWLESGKLTARVPHQARGFSIDTKTTRVVDLGTEFGLAVDASSGVVARTFAGVIEISWDPPADSDGESRISQRLAAGEALQISPDGVASTPKSRPADFVFELPTRVSPEQFTLDLGPLAFYRMERSGDETRLLDAAHGRTATLVDGTIQPRIVPGRVGRAVSLRGGAYADAGDIGAFARSDAFSYGAWVRPILGGQMAVVSRMQPNRLYRGCDLLINDDGRLMFHLIEAFPNSVLRVDSPEPLVADTWQHVLATYDGSGRAAGATLYIDGQPVHATAGADSLAGDFKTDTPLRIGRRGGDDAGGLAAPFQGDIDEFVLFDRKLSATEVEGIVHGVYRAAANKP